MADVRYPEIEVKLTGGDGNAFVVISTISNSLRKAKVSAEEIEEFQTSAISGDYDHVLQTCMAWVSVS